ncbi:MAG TPA: hypothetical protein PKA00_11740 [Saprospiraceae bacterium]|nr:hypothetical protein [Saprospiraceae bacterium]HMQ83576.1 hypothetical protein [Saprospiraceae bacterium]
MALNQYDTLVQAEQVLRERNFKNSFKLENNKMVCLETGNAYSSDEMAIVEYHRFEGETNPGDMSILFAVLCWDGEKGLIVSSYGPKSDMELFEFLNKVKIARKEQNEYA